MSRLSDAHARLSCFPEIVAQLETLQEELAWLAADSPHATLVALWCTYGADAGRYLPLSLAPILDRALLHDGIAVGWHTAPPHDVVPASLQDYAGRLHLGQLIHAAKHYHAPQWSTDARDVQAMGSLAALALASTRFGNAVDMIACVPSSRGTNSLPYQIARDVSFLTGIRYAAADSIRFGRHVPQVKDIRDYWTKRESLEGSMTADNDILRGRTVLLVDDVCRTGATLHEAARACYHAGATGVSALAISKTWKFQRIPKLRLAGDVLGLDAP